MISWDFEITARQNGYKLVAGVDEAGRGPLAGPVVACACILPHDFAVDGVDDSKKLSPEKRARIFKILTEHPEVDYGVGIVDAETIDKINILQATLKAMQLAVSQLAVKPDYILVDGKQSPSFAIPAQAVIKGDSLSYSIACASILAKVIRDEKMVEFHALWPQYGFDENKGYGVKKHLTALREHGPCPIHRMTFAPVK